MMAAYAALVSILNIIEQVKNHHRISTSLDKIQTESLTEKLHFLLYFTEEYSSQEGNEESDELGRQIASAAHEAEDVLESHIVEGVKEWGFQSKTPVFVADLRRVMQKMDSIKERVMKVKEEQHIYSNPAISSRQLATGNTRMVGFDDELIQLMDVLTGQQREQHIISITGMGGMGKSTLARNVYENLLIVEHFDVRAWTAISQKYSVSQILIDLLPNASMEETSSRNVHELGQLLYKFLWDRRYLVVLDDIWSMEAWDEIKYFFPDNRNGSRIVVTTRLLNVATRCSTSCFSMDFLDEDNSWTLFCKTVFGCEECPPELEGVGKKISELCKGLPLSIVVIGGLLRRSNVTVEHWKNVAKNINSVLSLEENDDCSRIIYLSYMQLDVHLKPCFLYMGIFREDCEIRASRIIKLWVAEGFIKANGAHMLEEIAQGYLNDLVDRNLILVGSRRYNGNIRSCRVHDLVRDVCLKVSKECNFFHSTMPLDINNGRRLILHDFITNDDDDCQMFEALESAQLVRSLICRGFTLPAVFRLVRVLTMANESSLEAIMQNLNLRSLTFQSLGTHALVRIPSSISLIWNLQTLAIHGKFVKIVVAPLEIWNMTQLRHVECEKTYLPQPPNDGVLENLQTLIKVVNLRLSEEVCKRIPNIQKLHLIYDVTLEGYEDSLFDHLHNLGILHKLQSLALVCPLHYPSRNVECCAFPESIKKISLKNCCLGWNDLSIIGSLPKMEVLKLDNSGKGQVWSPINGEFLCLKSLNIQNSDDLTCWNADSSHFPVLKKLTLVRVSQLEEIPSDIGDIPTLELIHVEDCSDSAGISAMEIKEEQESLGNDGLRIRVLKTNSNKEKLRVAILVSKAALEFIDPRLALINSTDKSLDYLYN